MKKSIVILFTLASMVNVYAQKTKPASAVMKEFLTTVGTVPATQTATYFAKDGTMVFPFVSNLGMPVNVYGQDSIALVVGNMLKVAPNFRIRNIKILMETPDMVIAEYESEAVLTNGRPYKQVYWGHTIVKDGKIVKHAEVMNTVSFVQAFFPNGLADLPATTK